MNSQQYFCNAQRIYLMQGILELNNVGYDVVGHTHFRLEISRNKYFIFNMFTSFPNDVKVTLNWEYIIEKVIYDTKRYRTKYLVNLL